MFIVTANEARRPTNRRLLSYVRIKCDWKWLLRLVTDYERQRPAAITASGSYWLRMIADGIRLRFCR